MLKFILKRVLQAIPVLLGLSIVVFLIMHVFSPDPAPVVLGEHATAEQMNAWRDANGLNQPLLKQYYFVGGMPEAVEDTFRYGKAVLATTTYNADIFPVMKTFIEHLTERNWQNKTVGLIENGSWAPTAAKTMKAMLEGSKNLTLLEPAVKITSALNADSRAQLEQLADALMA